MIMILLLVVKDYSKILLIRLSPFFLFIFSLLFQDGYVVK